MRKILITLLLTIVLIYSITNERSVAALTDKDQDEITTISHDVDWRVPLKISHELVVTATAYTANCNGCSGVTTTHINLKRNPTLKVIAVNPNIIELGTIVYVEGYGYAVAGDVNDKLQENEVNVFIPTTHEAYQWGRKDVKIIFLK